MRRAMFVTAWFVAASAANAAMPPWVYQKARANAPLHVQVEISRVSPPASTPGVCAVTGLVLRIFRDTPGTLSTGRQIAFPVACSRSGDPPLVGGTIWQDVDALLAARYIETYLEGEEAAYVVPLDQSRIIEAPSEAPQLPVE